MTWNDPTLPPPAAAGHAPAAPVIKKSPIFGILGTVFGGLSLIPFLGVLSPIGLILGIVGLVKKEGTMAIVGTCLAVAGIATSPILWGLAGCALNPSACQEMAQKIKDDAARQAAEGALKESGVEGELPADEPDGEAPPAVPAAGSS